MLQDDAALVAQVLEGEKSAFAPLIDRHRPGAIRLARRLLSGPADAEDVVQEALLQAFLGLRDLRLPDRFGAWLFGIVVNLCRMRLRSRHAAARQHLLCHNLGEGGDRVHEVAARPSDALNLALRVRAPIFVAPELFEQARISLLTQEGDPPEGGYVICMGDGRQMQGSELCPLLDEWHRQDLEAQGLPRETPEMGHGLLPRRQNPDQPGIPSVTPPAATRGADER